MRRHPLFGLALAAGGALALTPDTLFMRWSGLSGVQMLAWRGLLMGALLLVIWAVTSRAPRAELRQLASRPGIAVALFHFLNATFFSLGIAAAPVAVVLIAVATVPVFAAIFSWLLMGEPTRPATWVTIAVVLGGIALAVFGKDAQGIGLNAAALLGALAGLGVAVMLALTFVTLRAHGGVPILPAIGGGAFLSGLFGVVLSGGPAALGGEALWAIWIAGGIILPVSFFALSLASRYTHASNVSLLMLLETVLGPAWVWLGTGERPTPQMVLGGTVVVVSLAVYLVHTGRRRMRAAA